jgi:hypothetical protein
VTRDDPPSGLTHGCEHAYLTPCQTCWWVTSVDVNALYADSNHWRHHWFDPPRSSQYYHCNCQHPNCTVFFKWAFGVGLCQSRTSPVSVLHNLITQAISRYAGVVIAGTLNAILTERYRLSLKATASPSSVGVSGIWRCLDTGYAERFPCSGMSRPI